MIDSTGYRCRAKNRKYQRLHFKNRRYRKAIDLNNRLLMVALIVDKFVFYWTFVMSDQKCEPVQITRNSVRFSGGLVV
ncbi:hypothetical protein CWS43_22615 [Rahnella sp. AA]|nr:hypothetical protein CWS43_22615 [Rahnella sp. AA]